MSSASFAPPRTGPPSGARINYFWPIMVYFVGAGLLAFYQVQSLEDQLSEATAAADRIEPKVKMADYERKKFYALARDLLRLAPTHPAAAKIVDSIGIRKLAAAQPVAMSLDLPAGFTNGAPESSAAPKPAQGPASSTNASPASP
jgi:hypothetical protein